MSDPDASSQRDAQPTPSTDDGTDQLEEAIERARYEERMAAAEIPDHGDLFVLARVNEYDVPKLTTRAGGSLSQHELDGETRVEYAGGVSITREFDRVAALDDAFDALVERHDLTERDGDESGGQA